MDQAHKASAIAQIVFYSPTVPLTLYVGVRAWKYGPRLAWYAAMAFAFARLAGGACVLAIQNDPHNVPLLSTTIVLLNMGLVPLLMPFHALVRVVLKASFKDNFADNMFIKVTRLLLLTAVGLLGAAGGLYGHPDKADLQAMLSKIAYFCFVTVLAALCVMAMRLYSSHQNNMKNGHIVYIKWLLISSPFLSIRAVFGIISVFNATGSHFLTSTWSPMFGNALLFSLMALLPEFIVLCIFIHLGFYRIRTAERYGLPV